MHYLFERVLCSYIFILNFKMYGLINITNLQSVFEPLEILALIVSAISHDLDHDGYNNAYQINASTNLALIYNDQSPLEMYHCAVAFHILNKSECNILASLDRQSYRRIREYIIQWASYFFVVVEWYKNWFHFFFLHILKDHSGHRYGKSWTNTR